MPGGFDGAPPDSGGPSACDPSADAGTLVNPGFVRPSQVTQAYVGTASVGDADWSCLRTKTTDMPTSVSVTVSGVVLDFQTGDWVVGANVDVWATADTSGQPVATATSDSGGNYSLTLAPGVLRPTARVSDMYGLDTYTFNIPLAADQVTQTQDLTSVSALTANALPAFVGLARTAGTGWAVAKLVDCQGRSVANAIGALSATSAVTRACATHVPGAVTYYTSGGSAPLPVRHSQRVTTNMDGHFIIVESPPLGVAYLQAWGFAAGDDPQRDPLRLLGEVPLAIYADSVAISSVEPLRLP